MVIELPRLEITAPSTYRIIDSRYPRIDIFERIATPDMFKALLEIESMTNPRVRQLAKELEVVPEEDWVTGPGAEFIMSAFTKFSPDKPTRFSDGTYGLYYCARERETAIRETVFHKERFMASTDEETELITMRVLTADVGAELYDIRTMKATLPKYYAPDDYRHSQELGQQIKQERSWGIAYDSVRHDGGECFGIFRPSALSGCTASAYLGYFWDGDRIHVHDMTPLEDNFTLDDF